MFFFENMLAYDTGRAEKDPRTFWYKGEIGFFDGVSRIRDVYATENSEIRVFDQDTLHNFKSRTPFCTVVS